jgi:hypothetical protein
MTHWNFDQIKNSPDLSIMDISVKVGVQNIVEIGHGFEDWTSIRG